MPHYVASDLVCTVCLWSFYRFPGKNGLIREGSSSGRPVRAKNYGNPVLHSDTELLRCVGTWANFQTCFSKGENFFELMFASMDDKAYPERYQVLTL